MEDSVTTGTPEPRESRGDGGGASNSGLNRSYDDSLLDTVEDEEGEQGVRSEQQIQKERIVPPKNDRNISIGSELAGRLMGAEIFGTGTAEKDEVFFLKCRPQKNCCWPSR